MSDTLMQFLNELDALVAENRALKAEVERLSVCDNRPKLGRGEVAKIHEMRRAGYKLREIADSFDVNKSTISRIISGTYHK